MSKEHTSNGSPLPIGQEWATSYPIRYNAFDRPNVWHIAPPSFVRTPGCEVAECMIQLEGRDEIYARVYSYQMSHYVAQVDVRQKDGPWNTFKKTTHVDREACLKMAKDILSAALAERGV